MQERRINSAWNGGSGTFLTDTTAFSVTASRRSEREVNIGIATVTPGSQLLRRGEPLLKLNLHGVTRRPVHGRNDVHHSRSGQAVRKLCVDLVKAFVLVLRAGV
jgi:hypothetical protein